MTCPASKYRIRPEKGAKDVLMLTDNGKWVKDTGKPARAFSCRSPDLFPIAYYPDVECRCSFDTKSCPKVRAMAKTAERWSCSNGRARKSVLAHV